MIDDLIRFAIVQVLGQTDVVTNLEGGDDCIVLDSVTTRRRHQHSRRKAVDAVSLASEASVDAHLIGVFPIGVHDKAPGRFASRQ